MSELWHCLILFVLEVFWFYATLIIFVDNNNNNNNIFNNCDVIGQESNGIRWKTQNKGYYAVQGHSRSSRSVSIESPYATSY